MNNTQNLMKHFASFLRNKALGKTADAKINLNLIGLLSRKELVEVLLAKHYGAIPKELNLVEMENDQLLTVVGDQMHLLAYLSAKWSKNELAEAKVPVTISLPVTSSKKKGAAAK